MSTVLSIHHFLPFKEWLEYNFSLTSDFKSPFPSGCLQSKTMVSIQMDLLVIVHSHFVTDHVIHTHYTLQEHQIIPTNVTVSKVSDMVL